MKIKHLLAVLLILTCTQFYSCDALKKLADVTFDISVSVPFVINETAVNLSGKTYTDSKLLDLSSDPDVSQYANKIKKFKLNKITYTVSGANPNTVLFTNGTLKIVSTGNTIATASSINLSGSTETELTADLSGFNDLTTQLLNDNQEQIQLQGTLSRTPVTFTLTLKFYLTTTANPL
jgi:hypothetical protein